MGSRHGIFSRETSGNLCVHVQDHSMPADTPVQAEFTADQSACWHGWKSVHNKTKGQRVHINKQTIGLLSGVKSHRRNLQQVIKT